MNELFWGSDTLAISLSLRAVANIAPAIAIGVFALPSFIAILRQRGLFRGFLIFVILAGFAIAIETLAIKTGVPYGEFSYSDSLGYKIAGATPWVISLAYAPVLLFSFWLASKLRIGMLKILGTAVIATAIDTVLDPAAVKLELWKWKVPGHYFGVPVLNFIGWLVTATLAALILSTLWGGDKQPKRGLAYSGIAIIWFWSWVNAGLSQWLPAGIGFAISLIVTIIALRERKLVDEK